MQWTAALRFFGHFLRIYVIHATRDAATRYPWIWIAVAGF
jgi:hypothetical protein